MGMDDEQTERAQRRVAAARAFNYVRHQCHWFGMVVPPSVGRTSTRGTLLDVEGAVLRVKTRSPPSLSPSYFSLDELVRLLVVELAVYAPAPDKTAKHSKRVNTRHQDRCVCYDALRRVERQAAMCTTAVQANRSTGRVQMKRSVSPQLFIAV